MWPVTQVGSKPNTCPGRFQVDTAGIAFFSANCPGVSGTWKYGEIKQVSLQHESPAGQSLVLQLKTGIKYQYVVQPTHMAKAQLDCIERRIHGGQLTESQKHQTRN
jgi:hypothetical protein